MVQKDYGDIVTVSAVFMNSALVAVDPTNVYFRYYADAVSVSTTYTYGTSSELIKNATGNFAVNINTLEGSGIYRWRFWGTGTNQASAQGTFYVTPPYPA